MENSKSGHELIDTNLYLASLASNYREVDPMLDTLREITAVTSPARELTGEQTSALLALRRQLEEYLITKEQMRTFTPESLKFQVEHQKSGGKTRHALVLLSMVTALVFAGTALAMSLLPISGHDKLQTGGTIFFAMTHIGAVVLFLAAIPAFTTRLKTAFLWFCLAITLLGVSLVIQPLFLLYDAYDNTVAPILETLPIFVTAVSGYIGARLYAQPFLVLPRFASVGSVLLMTVILGGIGLVVPHASSAVPVAIFSLITCMLAAIVVLCGVAAVLLYKVSLKMSDLYRAPTRSLTAAIGLATLVLLYASVIRLAYGGPQPGIGATIQVGMVCLIGGSLIYTGYVLNKAAQY